MSRSRWPKCSGGRGCWVCGDAGEARRKREEDAARIDVTAALEYLDGKSRRADWPFLCCAECGH